MKLTSKLLKQIIEEEVSKFGEMESTEDRAKDAVELDADELGSDKAHDLSIDFMKALKIEESRLLRRLQKITEIKKAWSSK